MSENNKTPHIRLEKEIYDKLSKLKSELNLNTYNAVIKYLLTSETLVQLPDDKQAEVLQALIDVKPPSRAKEILLWFLLALAGGTGLGLFLAARW